MKRAQLHNISNTSSSSTIGGEFVLSDITHMERSIHQSRSSVKLVLSGIEDYTINSRKYPLSTDRFLIVNKNSKVDLHIEDKVGVSGVCIFPNQDFINDVFRNYKNTLQDLLDNPFDTENVELFEKMFSFQENRTGVFLSNTIVPILDRYRQHKDIDFETFYVGLVESMIQDQLEIEGKLQNLSSSRRITKEELYRRISISKDYIDAHYTNKIRLDELAKNACLSKYHFLRTFKSLYQLSPYQYLLNLRLNKAQELVKKEYSIAEINTIVGFSDERNLRKALRKLTS